MRYRQREKVIQELWAKKVQDQKVARHRLPNLCRSGMKFDVMRSDVIPFFERISNSIKLLQQPQKKISVQKRCQTQRVYYSPMTKKKHKSFTRTQQLAKPKIRFSKQSSQLKQDQYHRKHHRKVMFEIHKKNRKLNKQLQIIGSDFVSVNIDRIVAESEEKQRIKFKTKQSVIKFENDDDEQERISEKMENVEDFKPIKNNFQKWVTKIIGQNPNLYEKFEKKLLKNMKNYQPQQVNIHCCSAWR